MASVVQNNRQKNERHCIRCVWCVLFGSFSNDDGDDNESVIKAIECFHMTSWRPYWCPKTMKRRPCWSPRLILWELNSFLMQTLSFVPIKLRWCWPREWKRPTGLLSNTTNLHVHYTFLVHFYDHDSLCTDVPAPSGKIGRRDVCESPSLIVFRYTFA